MTVYRGDIFYVDWLENYEPIGSEIRPGRPAVVVSNDESNAKLNTVQVVYLTTKEKAPHPAHVSVLCKVPSTAVCEQITTIDKSRLGDYVRTCTSVELTAIMNGIMAVLGIKPVNDADVEKYRIKLATAEKKCADMDAMNAELMEDLTLLKNRDNSAATAKLEAERDVYKNLYHDLLDRVGVNVNNKDRIQRSEGDA